MEEELRGAELRPFGFEGMNRPSGERRSEEVMFEEESGGKGRSERKFEKEEKVYKPFPMQTPIVGENEEEEVKVP